MGHGEGWRGGEAGRVTQALLALCSRLVGSTIDGGVRGRREDQWRDVHTSAHAGGGFCAFQLVDSRLWLGG